MTRLLYLLPELVEKPTTAAQVRAAALLPLLATSTDLTVLTFERPGDVTGAVPGLPADRIIRVPRRRISAASLAFGTFLSAPRAFRRFDTPSARAALEAAIKKHQPDIVHFDGFATLGLMAVVKSARPECRIVAHVHDAQSARMERYTRMGSALNRFQKGREYRKSLRFERQRLGIADLTLVDSDEDRDYLRQQIGRDTVATLPLGFNPEAYSLTGPVEALKQPAIVYSGSMKADQSVDAAVFLADEVMPLVWARVPDAQLYIVGGGPTEKVLSLASDRVHVTGFVDDLAAYLRGSRVYACPLRLGSGMRTRVVEALACGTMMVATAMAVRGMGEPEDGATWVLADSATEFADAVVSQIERSDDSLGERAAAFAHERFAWTSVANRLTNYYAHLPEQRASSPARRPRRIPFRLLRMLFPDTLIEVLARLAGYGLAIASEKHGLATERKVRARLLNAKYGFRAADLGRHAVIANPSRVSLARGSSLHNNVSIAMGPDGYLSIGRNSHVSHGGVLAASAGIEIGSECAISSGVAIYSASNQRSDLLTIDRHPILKAPVKIGDKVFIGANAAILPGVTIGEGAVVAAGAVVTRDVAPHTAVGGVPARVIKNYGGESS